MVCLSRPVNIVTRLLKGLVCLTLSATLLSAAEPVDLSTRRRIEILAHRALARTRTESDTTLSPFATDGCSGGLSSAWTIVAKQLPAFAKAHGQTPPWESCCAIHDIAYHSAGPTAEPKMSFTNRVNADRALRDCVIKTGKTRLSEIAKSYKVKEKAVADSYRAIAKAMYAAVRLGGAPCSGMPWRWGYGYPNCFVTPSDFVE